MIKFLPILLALAYGYAAYRFSMMRSKAELDARSAELADPVLKKSFQRLANALDLPRIKVHLYDIAPVNGLASADGRVFITRGFYEKFRSGDVTDAELASVIAHELGHVALGHSRRRMIDFSGQNAIRMALGGLLNRFLPGIGFWIAGALTSLLAARLSRRDEYEADAYATALMIKAGFGADPQVTLLSKLGALVGQGQATVPAWLMSHPATEDRIAAIRGNAARWLNA